MKIEEKMLRRSQEDVIEIGEKLKKFYNSDAGAVIRAIINTIIIENISQEYDKDISSDRRLGRCEGVNKVRDMIEMGIVEMEKLTTPLPDFETDPASQ